MSCRRVVIPVLVFAIGVVVAGTTLPRLAGFVRGTGAALAADEDEEGVEAPDPPEVAIGERLFLETRFAQFFFANSPGDVNAPLAGGDPVVDTTVTTRGSLPGPFAGASMNCRACHLVDEQANATATPPAQGDRTVGGGNRTYADFARRSPVPGREDGMLTAPRNSPPLVNASLARAEFLLHFDGEFATLEDLIKETFLGRNFGWLPRERAAAVAHIARVIREDDGAGDLARSSGGPYAVVLEGTDPAIPPGFQLPPEFRLVVHAATDTQILDAVARLVAAYVRSLEFSRDKAGRFNGSPYDRFLWKNNLPQRPRPGESDLDYSRRLLAAVERLEEPRSVGEPDGEFELHDQEFSFGQRELLGLKVFLREPPTGPLSDQALREGGIGNCVACHPAPSFTDFGFHNTGAAQREYDAIHGDGAFAALAVPDLDTRQADFDAYLPPTPRHPDARGPFRQPPAGQRPDLVDLGLWNVFANPDLPAPQPSLRRLLCRPPGPCQDRDLLPLTIAAFKTPGLRDLGHSAPYLHTGRADTLEDVLRLYGEFSNRARAATMRNPAPPLAGMALTRKDIRALAAFLRALNEDYD